MNRTLRIGTRGSELALWQAHHVAGLLARLDGAAGKLTIQIVEIAAQRPASPPWLNVAILISAINATKRIAVNATGRMICHIVSLR